MKPILSGQNLVLIMIPLILIGIIGIPESFTEKSELIPSPRQQIESGTALEDVICKDNRVLVLRSNLNIACVSDKTLKRTGWEIIKSSFDEKKIPMDDEKIIVQTKKLENNTLSFSPDFKTITIHNNEIYNSTISQIQEYEESIKTPNLSLCDSKNSTTILNSFDSSTDLHIGGSWWVYENHRDTNSGIVCVIDPDMNLESESKDSFDISVWSTSDIEGIIISVTETNVSSGLFEGIAPFTNQKQSSENKLKVTGDDTVYVNYKDNTLPKPYGINDEIDITGTSQIGWNTPQYQIEYNMNIIDELKKQYTIFRHGEEKTAIDYALSQKIKNEKHLIVCDNEINSEQPYDPLDYPYDLFSRQYTIREHRPASNQLLHTYENSDSQIITNVQEIYNNQNLYALNPNDFLPTCLPLGQEVKFIVYSSSKITSDPLSYDLMDIIIAPNTLEITPQHTIYDLYNSHGIKIRIQTSLIVDDDFTKSKHFMSNYGLVSYSNEGSSVIVYCGFDDDNNKVCSKGFGTFNLGSSINFIADGKNISLSTYRYNIETLIDMVSSMENLNFEKTSDYLKPVDSEPKLKTYGGLYGSHFSERVWPVNWNNLEFDPLALLPQYIPHEQSLLSVYHSNEMFSNGLDQIVLWYSTTKPFSVSFEHVIDTGVSIVITDFVEYDDILITKFAKENNINLDSFNDNMSLNIEFEKGAYLLFYDKDRQIELYSKKYNLDELTKIAESLIGIN